MERTVLLVVAMTLLGAWMVSSEEDDPNKDCRSYIYCEGKHFPSETNIKGRGVRCDHVSNPKTRCCLPQAKHFVCYNIAVDGLFLNYQPNDNMKSTNFTGLCKEMLASQGVQAGRHTSITTDNDGGFLIWHSGRWVATTGGEKHIRTLACGYV